MEEPTLGMASSIYCRLASRKGSKDFFRRDRSQSRTPVRSCAGSSCYSRGKPLHWWEPVRVKSRHPMTTCQAKTTRIRMRSISPPTGVDGPPEALRGARRTKESRMNTTAAIAVANEYQPYPANGSCGGHGRQRLSGSARYSQAVPIDGGDIYAR